MLHFNTNVWIVLLTCWNDVTWSWFFWGIQYIFFQVFWPCIHEMNILLQMIQKESSNVFVSKSFACGETCSITTISCTTPFCVKTKKRFKLPEIKINCVFWSLFDSKVLKHMMKQVKHNSSVKTSSCVEETMVRPRHSPSAGAIPQVPKQFGGGHQPRDDAGGSKCRAEAAPVAWYHPHWMLGFLWPFFGRFWDQNLFQATNVFQHFENCLWQSLVMCCFNVCWPPTMFCCWSMLRNKPCGLWIETP